MKLPANRLDGHLREKLRPCYLVSGDDPLLVQEALDSLRETARKQGFESRDLHVQLAGFDWSVLSSAANELSLFASRRIIELRLPTGKPGREGSAAIAELAAQAGDDLLFIVQAPRLDRSSANAKWVKALDSEGVHVQVWPVDARELPRWIAGRMQHAGLEPEREAVRVVADRVEGNLLAASQEVEKLRLLLGPGAVTGEQVREAVADSSRFDVYKLADAALAGNASRALRILEGVRAEGVEPVIVLWALTRDLRTLAKLSQAIDAGTSVAAAFRAERVWESRQNLLRGCLGRHRRADFQNMLQAARQADAVAKGQQQGDAWQLLINLVWQLSMREAAA